MKTVLLRTALLSVALALSLPLVAQATSAANQTAVDNGVNYLKSQQVADGHIGAGADDTDWSAVAMAAAGTDLSTVQTSGGTSLRAYLSSNMPGASASANDWARRILAITADGQNPYTFGGVNSVAKLKSFASNHQLGLATGTNDDYFGLMALMGARVNLADAVVADEIATILSYQHADGGFSYTTTSAGLTSDVDDTAAAITALRAAQAAGASSAALTAALANAQNYLLALQHADGGFPYDPAFGPASNASSSAWALIALNAIGLGDGTDGQAIQAYLKTQQLGNGSFLSPWADPPAGDFLDTTPSVTALAGATWPVKVYEGTIPSIALENEAVQPSPSVSPSPSPGASPTPTPAVTPTPTPAAGDVLGLSTTDPALTAGNVLGTSTLPVAGEVSNLLLLMVAFLIAAVSGLGIRLHQLHLRRQNKI